MGAKTIAVPRLEPVKVARQLAAREKTRTTRKGFTPARATASTSPTMAVKPVFARAKPVLW